MTTKSPTPSHDEVIGAIFAGHQSIDDGEGFYDGFDEHLTSLGYQRAEDGSCTCPDQGGHGHMPECRWVRA